METNRETPTHPDYPLSPSVPEVLPEPTFWPIGAAFGVTLLFWGFLTSWIISAVGAGVLALSVTGWIGAFRG